MGEHRCEKALENIKRREYEGAASCNSQKRKSRSVTGSPRRPFPEPQPERNLKRPWCLCYNMQPRRTFPPRSPPVRWRPGPCDTSGSWAWACIAVTAGLALLKKEERTKNEDGIWDVYKIIWGVLKLKNT
jgi:hypothetical protein